MDCIYLLQLNKISVLLEKIKMNDFLTIDGEFDFEWYFMDEERRSEWINRWFSDQWELDQEQENYYIEWDQ